MRSVLSPGAVAAGILTGLVAGVILSSGAECLSRLAGRTSLLSDCDGALAEICLHYVKDFNDDSIETISDLLRALPQRVAVRVVVSERAGFDNLCRELAALGVPRREQMTAVLTGEPITPWAKDRFGSMRTVTGRAVLAVPPVRSLPAGPRANDEKVPELLARELPGLSCRALPFFFEGGDFLSDDSTAYVAASLLGRNQPAAAARPTPFLSLVGETLGRRVVPIGRIAADVPDHHIGMYMTPLGDNTVAMGDPLMGRTLYLRLPAEQRTVDVETNEAAYVPFRTAIEEVRSRGIRVVPTPLLLTRLPRVYVTYNNAILETGPGGKRIYMPVYGIPALDEASRRIYEAEGWSVSPVRVGKLYRHTGSLRCLVGIIRRS